MILVTGAAGKTGAHVIAALAGSGMASRALVRSEQAGEHALAAGASEIIVGDMTAAGIWTEALAGVSHIYLICPNMHPAELTIARQLLAAAGPKLHIVYHSVLHPQTEAMPHHWQKLRVEELLFASGNPFTILQPTAYMQNLLAGRERLLVDGILANPYPVSAPISLIDLPDLAEVAARVLTEPGHEGAIYELAGTTALTQTEVARQLSVVLDRPVQAQEIPLADWRTSAGPNLNPYALDTLSRMFRYYARHGLVGNPNVLRLLLGRKPATLADFARRELAT